MTWVKGRSGNPHGRPPVAQALAPALRGLLRERDPASGTTYRRLVAQALVQAACAGNVEAIRTIFERVDGKMPTSVEHSGPDGRAFELTFDYGHAVADLTAALLAVGPGRYRLPPGEGEVFGDGASVGEDADGG